MTGRAAVAALCVLTALVLQPALADRLGLPWGPPQLVVLVVCCLALGRGSVSGALTGFAAGLATDLLGDHVLGRSALVLALAGYVIGLFASDTERSAATPLLAVGLGSFAVVVADGLLGRVFGDQVGGLTALVGAAAGSAAYDVLLTPFVYPALRAVLGRPDPATRA